jgi:acyl-CoA synthetase
VIIRGGRNIHPAPIEALALRHDAIEKAAAFPVGDPRLGERVCLAIVTRHGMRLEPEAILEHLDASGLSEYDMVETYAKGLWQEGRSARRRDLALAQ